MAYDNKTEIVATVPAVGYYLHWIVDGELIEREPVVAFLVFKRPPDDAKHFNLSVDPMTANEVFGVNDPDNYVIERPDGKFQFPPPFCFVRDSLIDARLHVRATTPAPRAGASNE